MVMYLTAIKNNRILNVHRLDWKGSCSHLSKFTDKYENGTMFEFRFAHNSQIVIDWQPPFDITMSTPYDITFYTRLCHALDDVMDDFIHLYS